MEYKKSILIADDSPTSRELLKIIFNNKYNILEACDGKECIEILKENYKNISALLLDLHMPVLTGIDVLKFMKVNKMVYNIPVIVITGKSKLSNIQVEAFNLKAADFFFKPFVPDIIEQRVKNLIDLYSYKSNVEELLKQKSEELNQTRKIAEKTNEFLVDSLTSIVEFRNLESEGHTKRVKMITNILANKVMDNYPEYNLDYDKVKIITSASVLHDIGKIKIPESIILKPDKLTNDEIKEMNNHTIYGYDLLNHFVKKCNNFEFFRIAAEIAKHHHERYDGKGYPDRLSGEHINIASQIVSLADVYDTLISDRVYKSAIDIDEAYRLIINGEYGSFSAKLMHIFIISKPDIEKATVENLSN